MFSFRTVLAVGMLALASAPALPAQTEPSIPFATVLMARFDRLRQDPLIQRRTGAADALALLHAVKPDALGRITDAELVAFSALLARSLAAAQVETCADIHRKGVAEGFVPLAMEMDSTLALGWADFMEALVWASVRERPIGPRVPAAEVQAAYRTAIGALPAADQERFRRGYAKTGSAEDICYFARVVYGELLQLPPAQSAAVLRTTMFGAVP